MSSENQYQKDVSIDETALDVECLGQAKLMLHYSSLQAEAEREVARIKEKLDIVDAELDLDIRINPGDYGLQDVKITESVISSAKKQEKDYMQLQQDLIEAKYELNMLKGAVDAFRQRKDMLQELIRLHGQQYFAGPKVPRDLTYEALRQKERKEFNKKIKIGRKMK